MTIDITSKKALDDHKTLLETMDEMPEVYIKSIEEYADTDELAAVLLKNIIRFAGRVDVFLLNFISPDAIPAHAYETLSWQFLGTRDAFDQFIYDLSGGKLMNTAQGIIAVFGEDSDEIAMWKHASDLATQLRDIVNASGGDANRPISIKRG